MKDDQVADKTPTDLMRMFAPLAAKCSVTEEKFQVGRCHIAILRG